MKSFLPILTTILLAIALAVTNVLCDTNDKPASDSLSQDDSLTQKYPITEKPDTFPEMIKPAKPVYPSALKDAGICGVVWIKGIVMANGQIRGVQVSKSSGYPTLDTAAVVSANKCKFKPAYKNGQPVNVWVTWKVEFEIEKH